MKIIVATPVYPPEISGPAYYIKELALKLRENHQVTIVAYASTSEKIDGTRLFTISKRRPIPIRLAKYFVTLYKASHDADVIYVQNAMAAGLPAILVGKIRKIPVVIKYLSDEGYSTGIRMSIQKFVLRQASIITTGSAFMRDKIIKNYGLRSDKVKINFDPAIKDPEAPFPATQHPHQIITLAESRGSHKEKGKKTGKEKELDGIIRALAILSKKYPDVRAIIAGDTSDDHNVKRLAEELGVLDKINFTGHISRAETLHLRKSSEVYVLNSTHETTPAAALAAFSANLPIVAANISATNEVVLNNVSGLLVPVENDAALASAIEKLFEDAALRAKLIKGAEQILKEKFSWDAHLENLLGIFELVH